MTNEHTERATEKELRTAPHSKIMAASRKEEESAKTRRISLGLMFSSSGLRKIR